MPDYVPFLFDGSRLRGPLPLRTVALSLYDVVDRRTGLARFGSRAELLRHFRVDPTAKVVVTASGADENVERFWEVLKPKRTASSLHALRLAAIATPNFSMHCDAPRHDNLLSMKRIAECFETFAAARLPAVLHVNGRTPRDFERWAEYLTASPGVNAVCYEFGTIGGSSSRRTWHSERLIELAARVPRPLLLFVRGGTPYVPALRAAFGRVVLIDTTAHMKTKQRQWASRRAGTLTWRPRPTATEETLDKLLIHNVRVSSSGAQSPSVRVRSTCDHVRQ